MNIESVWYERFEVCFRLADGRRRRWVRWSPGFPWVYDEVGRELFETFGAAGVRERSATIRRLAS